jgi:undecaprenyl-diphosphatase
MIKRVDASLALALHDWTIAHPALANVIALIAESGIFLLPIAMAVVWLCSASAGHGPREAILVGGADAAVAFAVGLVLEHVLGRPRPFVALGFTPLFPHAADSSFPSDHTLVAVALVGPLLWRAPRVGVWLGLWAALIGVARICAGVHYPTDVLGSIALAFVVDAVVWLAFRPVLDRFMPPRWGARVLGSPPPGRRR